MCGDTCKQLNNGQALRIASRSKTLPREDQSIKSNHMKSTEIKSREGRQRGGGGAGAHTPDTDTESSLPTVGVVAALREFVEEMDEVLSARARGAMAGGWPSAQGG